MAGKSKRKSKRELKPKLRFPEFQDAPEWTERPLESIAHYDNGKAYEQYISESGKYIVVNSRFISTDGTVRKYSNEDFCIASAGDVMMVLSDLPNGRALAKCLFADVDDLYAVNQRVCRLHPYDIHNKFLFYRLNRHPNLLSYDDGLSQTHLSKDNVLKCLLCVPSQSEEQRKIAGCLSSLDELIGAESRRLEALQAHKKGLMQQLFPREGETLPRLRFPEFKDDPEWEIRTIGEMFSLINGCAFKPEDWQPSGTPIIRIQNLNDPSAEFNYSQEPVPERNRVDPGDLLFAWSGTLGSSFGARIWNGPSGVLNQHIFKVLMDEQQIIIQFAVLVLARVEEEIARRTHGFKASFVHVKKSDLVKVEMLLPSVQEQQQIATCLSSLDALITTETQKVDGLKTHKKGLMQQLFPSLEDAHA